MNGHAVAARAAAAVVALVAGAASFSHIADVAIGAGERVWVAASLPLAIDGLIVVGVAALLEDRRADRVPRMSARLAVLVGVVATLAANVASAEPTWTARLVAIAAPVAFLLSVEVLTRTGRRRADAANGKPPAAGGNGRRATQSGQSPPTPAATPRRRRSSSAAERVAAAVARTPDATPAQIAARLKVSERTVTRHWPAPSAVDTVSSPNGAAG